MPLHIVACPNDCSGRGSCLSVTDLARIPVSPDSTYTTITLSEPTLQPSYTPEWEADAMYACLCDSSWPVGFAAGQVQLAEYFGPDCSLSKGYYDKVAQM